MAKKWTEEELGQLYRLAEDSLPWAEIGNLLGRTGESCRAKYKRERGEVGSPLQPFVGSKESIPWQERLDVAELVQGNREKDDITVKIAQRTVITNRPFGVWFTGDLHLGSVGTRLDIWKKHVETFMGIEGLAVFFMGDYIANVAMHKYVLPVFQQVLSPEEQGLTIVDLLSNMVEVNKILAVVLSEEHDQRDARQTGVSFLRQLLRPMENDIPFLDNRGVIILHVGPSEDKLVPYVIYVAHKARYRSFLNELHTANRLARLDVPANVIATAHTHRPAMGKYNWFQELKAVLEFAGNKIILGGNIYCIQCGTYEQDAQYGNQQYGWLPEPEVQALVFDPHRHHIEMATSFSEVEKLL